MIMHGWAGEVRNQIEPMRLGKYIIAVQPMISVSMLRFSMFRKDRAPHFRHLRKTLQAPLEFRQVPAVIRAEIEGWDRD